MPAISHQELLKQAKENRNVAIGTTEQNKTVPYAVEGIDSATGPTIINIFVHLSKFFSHLKLPFLFFADLAIKALVNPLKIAQLWQSNKPLPVKIIGTTARILTYALMGMAVSTAAKPVAASLAKAISAAIAGSAGPFLFTLTFSIFTALSALDLKNKVKDLNDHPWKATKIQKLKRTNKAVKTTGLAIGTVSIWPMFKFGLIPLLVAGKVTALVSNPIGWAVSGVIGLSLIGVGAYKLYARQKLRKIQRNTARTLVDNAIDPEATLEIDLDKIKAETKKNLIAEFNKSNTSLASNQNSPKYQQKLNDYLNKGSLWNRIKAKVGGGSPLGRAYSKAVNDKINEQFNKRADAILGFNEDTYKQKLAVIKDYKRFGTKELTLDEKVQIAREDYLKYGKSRYDVAIDDKNYKNLTWSNKRECLKELEKKKDKFNASDKANELTTLQQHSELLSSDYGRDYYQKTQRMHESARDQEFNPYEILDVSVNASQKEIKRAYESKLKNTQVDKAKVQQAYDCLNDKQHREYFDITFAAYHDKQYKLYAIIRGSDDNTPITDAKTLKEQYKITKKGLKRTVSSSSNKDKLKELEWAYRLLKDDKNRVRYEHEQKVKEAYDAKVAKINTTNEKQTQNDQSINLSTYGKLMLHSNEETTPPQKVSFSNGKDTEKEQQELMKSYRTKTAYTYGKTKRNISGTTDIKRVAGRIVRKEAHEILKNSIRFKAN